MGKSQLAVALAERLGGEVISADSRQVYKGMDIGTAKPGPDVRRRVPHHGLDLIEPDARYSAGRFARDAWRWIEAIEARGGLPMVVGGTGLFLRALLDPLAPEPDFDRERRKALRRYLSALEVGDLKRWLGRLDPRRARDLAREGGSQRLLRSLEVALLSGHPHTEWLSRPPEQPRLHGLVVCLTLPRADLYERIDRRLDVMVRAGLVEEVEGLLRRFPTDAPGLRSVGYAEMIDLVRGELAREEAVEAAKRSTRRFARRQLTWFRHQLPGTALRVDAREPAEALAERVAGVWAEASGSASD